VEQNDSENTIKYDIDKDEFKKNLAHYRMSMQYLGANVPIECLCLPVVVQNILIQNDFIRVYDLLHHDFRKVKGLGTERIRLLTSRLRS